MKVAALLHAAVGAGRVGSGRRRQRRRGVQAEEAVLLHAARWVQTKEPALLNVAQWVRGSVRLRAGEGGCAAACCCGCGRRRQRC